MELAVCRIFKTSSTVAVYDATGSFSQVSCRFAPRQWAESVVQSVVRSSCCTFAAIVDSAHLTGVLWGARAGNAYLQHSLSACRDQPAVGAGVFMQRAGSSSAEGPMSIFLIWIMPSRAIMPHERAHFCACSHSMRISTKRPE